LDRIETALELFRSGNPRAALAAASAACEQDGESASLLTLMSELHAKLDEPAAALDCLRRAALSTPLDAGAHRRLAGAQYAAGLWGEAIASYRRSLELDPANARALNNLGQAYERLVDLPAALACYRRALAIDGSYAIAFSNLAGVLVRQGQAAEALENYTRALALRPGLVEASIGRSTALLRLQRPQEALTCCDRALALAPRSADAWFARGEALQDMDRCAEALDCCEQALAIRPQRQFMFARANLLRGMGEAAAAVAGFRDALTLDPDYHAARIAQVIALIPALAGSSGEAAQSRGDYAAALAEVAGHLRGRCDIDATACIGAVQPFFLAYQEVDQRPLLAAHGALCSELMGRWQQSEGLPLCSRKLGASRIRRRIAIVSAQISDHSVYNAITRGWVTRLDRKRFEVEVFHIGHSHDAMTEEAQQAAEHFVTGLPTVRDWCLAITDRSPDVVLYPELGMNQWALQLAALRLAPVQAVSWGHPVTSGLPTMDYFLSAEAFEPEEGANHYTEQLVRLPNLGVYCLPGARYERHTVAARPCAAEVPLFVCAGTPFKYAPEHDAVLVEIAQRLGNCQFHFFSYRDGALSRRLMQRLRGAFRAAGLDGERYLILRPWACAAQFQAFLRCADLYLDTLGFSGFNTMLQALECGVPVVGYRGRFMRGRLGSGLLERLSLSRLVAASPREYTDLVVALIRDRAALAAVRERLRTVPTEVYEDAVSLGRLQEFLATVTG
jgi:predicted O-linked N-acetylglucosamine transferase (SPINDLY family)